MGKKLKNNQTSISVLFLFLSVIVNPVSAEVNFSSAIGFIENAQLADGSFDAFSTPNSAAAVLALHAADSNSTNFSAGMAWLKADLENLASYSWYEADIPGINLFVYSTSGNVSELNMSDIKSRLLDMQGGNGGFRGYSQCVENCSESDWTKQVWSAVEDSVSTSAALMGLAASCDLDTATKSAATDYLLSLLNEDGSFNLTNDTSYSQLMGLGPDAFSQTAFVLLGMRMAGADAVSVSLEYLKNGSLYNFSNANSTFAAAMAILAFRAYNETNSTMHASEYLSSLQNPDGGFRDGSRFGSGSNVLDTAAAMLAAYSFTAAPPSCLADGDPTPSPSPSPTAEPSPSPTPTPYSYSGSYYGPSASPTPTPSPSPEPSDEPETELIEIETEPSVPEDTPTIKNAAEESVANGIGNVALQASGSPSPTPPILRTTGLFGLGAFPSYAIITLFIFISVGLYFGLRSRWSNNE